MKLFKQRDYTLNVETDWQRNIQPRMSKDSESVAVYDKQGAICGWDIQYQYE